MEGIIKLIGTIAGISPVNDSIVNIKLDCKEYAVKKHQAHDYGDTQPFTLSTSIVFSYEGPAHLGRQAHNEFAFSPNISSDCYGIGAHISDLFIGDEAEVYAHWHSDDTGNIHLDHVIIGLTSNNPSTQLFNFIKAHIK